MPCLDLWESLGFVAPLTGLIMEGKKYSNEKPTPELLVGKFISDMSEVLRIGKEKYGEDNWKNPPLDSNTYKGAAMRHLLAALDGQIFDPEDGATHLSKVAVNCMFADWHWHKENWNDFFAQIDPLIDEIMGQIAEENKKKYFGGKLQIFTQEHFDKLIARQEEKGR